MERDPFGVWEIVVPAKNGQPAIPHNTKVKVRPITITHIKPQTDMIVTRFL